MTQVHLRDAPTPCASDTLAVAEVAATTCGVEEQAASYMTPQGSTVALICERIAPRVASVHLHQPTVVLAVGTWRKSRTKPFPELPAWLVNTATALWPPARRTPLPGEAPQ